MMLGNLSRYIGKDKTDVKTGNIKEGHQQTRSTAGLMEGWQCIVQVHDVIGTKPLDLPSIIQQMRENKQGRLRKFYNDTLLRKRDVSRLKERNKEDEREMADSVAIAEEKWAKRIRQEQPKSSRAGKYQQPPKKQLKISAMMSRKKDHKVQATKKVRVKTTKVEQSVGYPGLTNNVNNCWFNATYNRWHIHCLETG
ncbi:hypothetical protein OS493_032830 [Desmophyllum pertusum]|uniref:Uncharacterized protein n=1 Tax=Desmophyllum pertusum TaxID=174260 RepID=A0A9X0CNK8_9CNID|nr:hypothetical protein OS493_032830 [Desmophyllum pertusum]